MHLPQDLCSPNVQINYRMRATLKDGRQLVGQMLAFDKVPRSLPLPTIIS